MMTFDTEASRIFGDWCDATTAHGVKDAYDARKHKAAFIFWISIVLVAFGLQTWQISELFKAFINGPSYGTSIVYTETGETLLPSIVVCNSNRANVSKQRELGLDDLALTFLFSGFYMNFVLQMLPAQAAPYKEAWDNFMRQGNNSLKWTNPHELLKTLAHSCEGTFASGVMRKIEPVDVCKVARTIVNVYGICFVLPENYTQKMPGPANGLRLILDPRTDLYAQIAVGNDLDEGFSIMVTFDPDHPFPTNPIMVSPGTHALISVSTETRRFDPPTLTVFDWPCSNDVQLKALKAQFNSDTCTYDCYIYYSGLLCNCTVIGVEIKPNGLNLPPCAPGLPSLCLVGISQNASWVPEDVSKKYKSCVDACRDKNTCEERRDVITTASAAKFPSAAATPAMLIHIQRSHPEMTVQRISSTVVVDIFYSQLGTTIIQTQETMPVFQFVSNIGGQIGLWMGASLVTLVQAMFYLAKLKHFLLKKICHRTIRPVPPGKPEKPGIDNVASVHIT